MPPLSRSLSRLRSVDFYRKLPTDLTEATLTGAWLSIAASVLMSTLLVLVRGPKRIERKPPLAPAASLAAAVQLHHVMRWAAPRRRALQPRADPAPPAACAQSHPPLSSPRKAVLSEHFPRGGAPAARRRPLRLAGAGVVPAGADGVRDGRRPQRVQ
jgi:hypothetical protein